MPPWLRGVLTQAQWENSLSVEQPTTATSRLSNSPRASWKPISLGRAHEGKILRVEEQDYVLFALKLVKAEIRYDGTVYNCVCTKMRCRFSYEKHGRFFGLVLKE